MIDHQPTDQELQAMQDARQRLTEANEAVGDDPQPGSQALTDLAEAAGAFQRAVHVVLYGPHGEPPKRLMSAYEASNEGARAAWPTRPPGTPPGG